MTSPGRPGPEQRLASSYPAARRHLWAALAVGLPLETQDLKHQWRRYAAAWVGFPSPGRVAEIRGLDKALSLPGVKEVFVRMGVGEVIPPYADCAARPVFAIAAGDSYDEAVKNAKRAVAAVEFVTTEP